MSQEISSDLVKQLSVSYPEKFRIDLVKDPFPWFLLSVLFGARISESIAVRTFFLFNSEKIMSPEAIVKAGWDRLVVILDSGGYTRYDFKTATKLIEMSRNVLEYGTLNALHDKSSGPEELVENLKGLSKGIGDVTAGIFLREMIGVWGKAAPHPSPLIKATAEMLNIDLLTYYKDHGLKYAEMETFLLNVGRKCFRSKCRNCIFPDLCKEYARRKTVHL